LIFEPFTSSLGLSWGKAVHGAPGHSTTSQRSNVSTHFAAREPADDDRAVPSPDGSWSCSARAAYLLSRLHGPRRIQVRGGFQQIRKSLDNIDKRAGIYGNFLYKHHSVAAVSSGRWRRLM